MLNYLDARLMRWARRLGSKKIYILPTKVGFYFSGVVFILFIISFSYGHSLAYSTAFLLVSVIVISLPYTNYNLGQLEVKMGSYDDLCEGDTQEIELRLKNRSRYKRYDIEAELIFFTANGEQTLLTHAPLTLETRGRAILKVGLAQLKFGHYQEVVVRLKSSFPFGLFFAWNYSYLALDLWVYPERLPPTNAIVLSALPLADLKSREEVKSEVNALGMVSEHEDFSGHGLFLPGHSFGSIDWKVYARTGKLYIKEFEERAHELLYIQVKRSEQWRARAGEITWLLSELARQNRQLQLDAPDFELSAGPGSGSVFVKGVLRRLVLALKKKEGERE